MEDIKSAVRSMACSITKKRHLCFRPWKTDSTLKHLSVLVKLVHGYGGVAYKDSVKKSRESNFCVGENSERAVNHSKEQPFFFSVWHKGLTVWAHHTAQDRLFGQNLWKRVYV